MRVVFLVFACFYCACSLARRVQLEDRESCGNRERWISLREMREADRSRAPRIARGAGGSGGGSAERKKGRSGQLPASLEASLRQRQRPLMSIARSLRQRRIRRRGKKSSETGPRPRVVGETRASRTKRDRCWTHAKTRLSLISTLVIRLPFLLRVTNARMRAGLAAAALRHARRSMLD